MSRVRLQPARDARFGPVWSPSVIINERAYFWDSIPQDVLDQLEAGDLERIQKLTEAWRKYLPERPSDANG